MKSPERPPQAEVILLTCGHWTRRSHCTGTIYDYCVRCGRYINIVRESVPAVSS